MSEHELHDLLHRVVPEAPAPDAGRLVGSARRRRTRRRSTTAGLVAATTVAAIAVAVPTLSREDAPGVPEPPVSAAAASTAPYDANTCPTPGTVPEAGRAIEVDAADVVAVTWCAVEDGGSDTLVPQTPEALVTDPAVLVEELLPVMDRQVCLTLSYLPPGIVTFRHADGSEQSIQPGCDPLVLDGVRTTAYVLPNALLAALDEQRDRLTYRRAAPVPTCDSATTAAPVRPGREAIVAAVACSDDGAPLGTVGRDALAGLQEAWATAQPLSDARADECYLGSRSIDVNLVATTDRGDVVRLPGSPCGGFAHSHLRDAVLVEVAPGDLDLG